MHVNIWLSILRLIGKQHMVRSQPHHRNQHQLTTLSRGHPHHSTVYCLVLDPIDMTSIKGKEKTTRMAITMTATTATMTNMMRVDTEAATAGQTTRIGVMTVTTMTTEHYRRMTAPDGQMIYIIMSGMRHHEINMIMIMIMTTGVTREKGLVIVMWSGVAIVNVGTTIAAVVVVTTGKAPEDPGTGLMLNGMQ